MKILPIVKNIRTDLASTGIRLHKAGADGYKIGDRTAKIYHQNSVCKYWNVTRSVSGKIVKGTSVRELPYLAGAIGMFVPLPLISPTMLGIGFIVREFIETAKKLKPKNSLQNNYSRVRTLHLT